MEDKYLEIILKLSEENGSLKKENEYLKEELNKYKRRPLKSKEIREKFMNIGKNTSLNNDLYTEEELDNICKDFEASFSDDNKTRKSASQRLNETLEKYRGK
jgi:hypothetical protein